MSRRRLVGIRSIKGNKLRHVVLSFSADDDPYLSVVYLGDKELDDQSSPTKGRS